MPASATTTRLSLLLRIRDAQDGEAWVRFVQIYAPLIYRFGTRRGLQDSDAHDLTQDVLRAVSRSIGRFDYDPDVGRFRTWLLTVAKFTLSRMRKVQNRQPVASGDSGTQRQIEETPADDPDGERWNEEYNRRVFEWAAERVQKQVQPDTWRAFEMTAIEQRPSAEVAERLGMRIGSVYVARNRVMARMRKTVREIDDL